MRSSCSRAAKGARSPFVNLNVTDAEVGIHVHLLQGGGSIKYIIRGSFLEIYNDRIFDLLNPHSFSLSLHEDVKKGVYVANLTEEPIETAADCLQLMMKGAENRRVGETAMNRESSRSHCVFTLTIQSTVRLSSLRYAANSLSSSSVILGIWLHSSIVVALLCGDCRRARTVSRARSSLAST